MKLRMFLALAVSACGFGAGAQAQTNPHPAAPVATPAVAGASAVSSTRKVTSADSTQGGAGQALRFESSWWSADIIRGADGPVLGTVGWFRDFDLEKLVQSSPRALAEARQFETNNFRGSVVSAIGATTLAIGVVDTIPRNNNPGPEVETHPSCAPDASKAQRPKLLGKNIPTELTGWIVNAASIQVRLPTFVFAISPKPFVVLPSRNGLSIGEEKCAPWRS